MAGPVDPTDAPTGINIAMEASPPSPIQGTGIEAARHRLGLLLYVVISFLSASLVFVVQPMATRILLPSFGGSAAVWNTALVVFQVLLLTGYLFAHMSQKLGRKLRTMVQVGLLALPLATLPFPVTVGEPGANPTLSLMLALARW